MEPTNNLREVRVTPMLRESAPQVGRTPGHEDVPSQGVDPYRFDSRPIKILAGFSGGLKCKRESKELGIVQKILRRKHIKLQDSRCLISSSVIKPE